MSATLTNLLLKFSWGRCWYEWVWPLPEISRLWSHFKQLQRKIRGVMRTTIFSAYWLKFWFSLFLLRRGAYHFNQISDGATALVFRLRSHKLSFGPVSDILIPSYVTREIPKCCIFSGSVFRCNKCILYAAANGKLTGGQFFFSMRPNDWQLSGHQYHLSSKKWQKVSVNGMVWQMHLHFFLHFRRRSMSKILGF